MIRISLRELAPKGAPLRAGEQVIEQHPAVTISRAIEQAWPPLPKSWPPVEPLATCATPDCGCTDLDPLVARIAATMGRLDAPRVHQWGAAQYVVQRERQVLYTGSEFRWTVRDRTLPLDLDHDLPSLGHLDGTLLGSFDTFARALEYVVALVDGDARSLARAEQLRP